MHLLYFIIIMKYYLVQYSGNYADEFDIYFHTVMSEDELKEAKKTISNTSWEYEEFYFGTNESIDISTYDLIQNLNNAKELTEEQYNVLTDLGITNISFGDGLNWYTIIERAKEWLEKDE